MMEYLKALLWLYKLTSNKVYIPEQQKRPEQEKPISTQSQLITSIWNKLS
jgi:hypothetical protein